MKESDFKIVKKGVLFHIYMRERFLLFFDRWVEVTWTENNKETPIQFSTYKEAQSFIHNITD